MTHQAELFHALFKGVLDGDEKNVEAALKAGALVNNVDDYDIILADESLKKAHSFALLAKEQKVPILLHLAIDRGNEKICQLLLDHKADVNGTDVIIHDDEDNIILPHTPLHLAAETGNSVLAELLLKNGAEIDSDNSAHNKTPLVIASEKGHKELIAVLISKGANPNRLTDIPNKPDEKLTHNPASKKVIYQTQKSTLFGNPEEKSMSAQNLPWAGLSGNSC